MAQRVPVALLALYFLHAFFQTFPMTAYGDWLFDVIHMPPATTTIYYSVAFFPWNLKPLYGLLSDTLPILGYHRKSYIMFCEIGAALSLFCTGAYVDSIAGAFVVRVLDAVFEAFAQIMLGVFLVDLAVGDPTSTTSARVQSLANGTKNAASIAALVLGIPVYKDKNITPQQVISWTSLMPLIAAGVCLLGLYEEPTVASRSATSSSSVLSVDDEESWWDSMRSSWRAFKRDLQYKFEVLLPVLPAMLFFFLCSALPGDGMVWYQYTFSAARPARVRAVHVPGRHGRSVPVLLHVRALVFRTQRAARLPGLHGRVCGGRTATPAAGAAYGQAPSLRVHVLDRRVAHHVIHVRVRAAAAARGRHVLLSAAEECARADVRAVPVLHGLWRRRVGPPDVRGRQRAGHRHGLHHAERELGPSLGAGHDLGRRSAARARLSLCAA